MTHTSEQIISRSIRAVLSESEQFRKILLGFEFFLPAVLAEIHPEWEREALDGVLPLCAFKRCDREADIRSRSGWCIGHVSTPFGRSRSAKLPSKLPDELPKVLKTTGNREVKSGWGGIRTPGTLAGTAVFKTAAIVHSATHPSLVFSTISKNRLVVAWQSDNRSDNQQLILQ